jgi:hypothetical protein
VAFGCGFATFAPFTERISEIIGSPELKNSDSQLNCLILNKFEGDRYEADCFVVNSQGVNEKGGMSGIASALATSFLEVAFYITSLNAVTASV